MTVYVATWPADFDVIEIFVQQPEKCIFNTERGYSNSLIRCILNIFREERRNAYGAPLFR
jgi:hypothetical protein